MHLLLLVQHEHQGGKVMLQINNRVEAGKNELLILVGRHEFT